MRLKRYPALVASFLLSGGLIEVSAETFFVNYDLQPKLIDTVLVPTEKNQLRKAQFNSGLGLALRNQLFDFSMDYTFRGSMQRAGDADQGQLSQIVTASMSSVVLNELFAVDATVDANSVVREGGDSYHYNITPGFSRSISNLADLNVKYNYKLAKPSSIAAVKETKGYSFGLNGDLDRGRLTWKGLYSESSVFKDQLLRTESTEVIDFNSRYHLISDLHLEVSSAIKNRTLLNGMDNLMFSEKRFGAGIAWSPSEQYSFALNVNKIDESRFNQQEYYGGGAVTWSPKYDLELSLGYGDQLIDGARGLILKTKVDLDSD